MEYYEENIKKEFKITRPLIIKRNEQAEHKWTHRQAIERFRKRRKKLKNQHSVNTGPRKKPVARTSLLMIQRSMRRKRKRYTLS